MPLKVSENDQGVKSVNSKDKQKKRKWVRDIKIR